ncbi:hypothetical protein Btru_056844 [Bulinus truncatus]|nr:hypothetical protein Btru_056844 [Bulinus truncatus]
MYMDDLQYARLLQEKYDREAASQLANTENVSSRITRKHSKDIDNNNSLKDLSPVDPSLELSDPNPNILTLFLQFNEQFFWGRLSGIEVKWSPRMTLCAGLCVYEGRGGLCSVRLSLPLLKLRPRKDLVETLLHEMIHAYLFITDNDRDHDGHGPNFKSHMDRINKSTGANISVYHNFHDEVESYQQHWWRCDGPCQSRRPYYGYVKRSMNREPSPRDIWWAEHQMTCGGKFTKIKEPENYGQKKNKGKQKDNSVDIRAFVGKGSSLEKKENVPKNGSTFSKITGSNNNKIKNGSDQVKNGTQTALVVNGVLIRRGTSSSPLFSTGLVQVPLKTSASKVDLTSSSSSVTAWNEDEDDSWMLEAEEVENFSSKNTNTIAEKDLANNPSEINASSINPLECRKADKGAHRIPKRKGTSNHPKENGFYKFNRRDGKMFSDGFVSVCEPVGTSPYRNKIIPKKLKFMLSDSDNDDDLWEEKPKEHLSDGNSQKLSESEQLDEQRSSRVNPLLRVNQQQPLGSVTAPVSATQGSKGLNCHISDAHLKTNEHYSPVDSGHTLHDVVDCTDEMSPGNDKKLSVHHKEVKYSGPGYRLGTAEQGTTYLSLIRKNFNTASSSSNSSKGLPVTQPSSSNENKRTSEIAFGSSSPDRKNSLKSVRVSQEHETFSRENLSRSNKTGNGAQEEDFVMCPVCNKPVEPSVINNHLDDCLL